MSASAGFHTAAFPATNVCPVIITFVQRHRALLQAHGGFADRVRAQWTWVRPIPEALDLAKAGPLLCGGVTVFSPFLIHHLPSTARVGVIGIGGLGHMALQFANKWGCEVHCLHHKRQQGSRGPQTRRALRPQHQAGWCAEENCGQPRLDYLDGERWAGCTRRARHACSKRASA